MKTHKNINMMLAFVGTAVALFSLAFSIYSFYSERTFTNKRLSVQLLSLTELVGSNVHNNKIKIMYDNDIVNDFVSIRIKVVNDGNQDISKNDFIKPLKIPISGCNKIFYINEISSSPRDFDFNATLNGCEIEFGNTLYNKKDEVVVEVAVEPRGDGANIRHPTARIEGIKEVSYTDFRTKDISRSKQFKQVATYILLGVVSILFLIFSSVQRQLTHDFASVIAPLIIDVFKQILHKRKARNAADGFTNKTLSNNISILNLPHDKVQPSSIIVRPSPTAKSLAGGITMLGNVYSNIQSCSAQYISANNQLGIVWKCADGSLYLCAFYHKGSSAQAFFNIIAITTNGFNYGENYNTNSVPCNIDGDINLSFDSTGVIAVINGKRLPKWDYNNQHQVIQIGFWTYTTENTFSNIKIT